LKIKYPLIGDVRGRGLVIGIELVTDRVAKSPANQQAEKVMYAAMERGLSFKTTFGNVLTWTPPLTVTEADMARAISILDESISGVA